MLPLLPFQPEAVIFDPKCQRAAETNSLQFPLTMIETLYHYYIGNSQFDLRQNFYSFYPPHYTYRGLLSRLCLRMSRQAGGILCRSVCQRRPRTGHRLPDRLLRFRVHDSVQFLEDLTDMLYARLLDYWKLKKKEPPLPPTWLPLRWIRLSPIWSKNYYLDLDLSMISDLISMNSSYFSSLFKRRLA